MPTGVYLRTPFSKEHRENISKARKGKPAPWSIGNKYGIGNKSRTGQTFTHSVETRKKISLSHLGEKSYAWKGGVTPLYKQIRKSMRYREWRKAVFERDKYTCQICHQEGGTLQADHIKRFADFPELRFDIANGRTLCLVCHRATDTYGNRKLPPRKGEHSL